MCPQIFSNEIFINKLICYFIAFINTLTNWIEIKGSQSNLQEHNKIFPHCSSSSVLSSIKRNSDTNSLGTSPSSCRMYKWTFVYQCTQKQYQTVDRNVKKMRQFWYNNQSLFPMLQYRDTHIRTLIYIRNILMWKPDVAQWQPNRVSVPKTFKL